MNLGAKEDASANLPIRVLVADDHDLFRTGLAAMLAAATDIEVVGQASGGRMAVRLADELRPDVILMDARMPDLDGTDATRQILERHPAARVVAFTVGSGEADVEAAMAAGACGFVVKGMSVDDVLAAVRAAARGAAWLSAPAEAVILGRMRRYAMQQRGPDPIERLSSRELDVLRLIAQGKDNAEIAATLNISVRTAKNHVSNILAKLGVPNRVQAAVLALRRDLI